MIIGCALLFSVAPRRIRFRMLISCSDMTLSLRSKRVEALLLEQATFSNTAPTHHGPSYHYLSLVEGVFCPNEYHQKYIGEISPGNLFSRQIFFAISKRAKTIVFCGGCRILLLQPQRISPNRCTSSVKFRHWPM